MFRHPAWVVGSYRLMAQQLLELTELSQREVFTVLTGHPVGGRRRHIKVLRPLSPRRAISAK